MLQLRQCARDLCSLLCVHGEITMMCRLRIWPWWILFVGFVFGPKSEYVPAQVSFTPLGELGDPPSAGFVSDAFGLSGDGLVAVGFASSNLLGGEAFRWTRDGGMVGLGSLPAVIPGSRALAASRDGSVIAGSSNFGAGSQAFRWSAETGMVGLGTLSGGIETLGIASSISADGSVIVGVAGGAVGNALGEAFRWTATTGMMSLADRPSGFFHSRAQDVSADGSVVIGTIEIIGLGPQAFRWTMADGLVPLPEIIANAVSADGLTIVGSSGGIAGLWTEMGGIRQLGDLPGGIVMSGASDVSADGSLIVGAGETDKGSEAMFWTEATGMVNLHQFLFSHGIGELADWRLPSAAAVSADGRTIVGTGINPAGLREAWIATIPEPSTFILVALASAGWISLHRAKSRRANSSGS
jgi:probable HAF family extracellular repeat protein